MGDVLLPGGAVGRRQRYAVDPDFAFAWFQQAQDQIHQGRFAASGLAGQADARALGNFHAHG
jgi:hypothetical protein